MSGFARKEDLPYFLDRLADGCAYLHLPDLAPTKEILKDYRADGDWNRYVLRFEMLMDERGIPADHCEREDFEAQISCLLCSEATPEQCHRRLVAERLGGTLARCGDHSSMKKPIVITEVTRMQEGRVCIAGYDQQGQCLRPVLPPPGIHESALYSGPRPIIFPSAKVEFEFTQPTPQPPHTEDIRYDPASVRFIERQPEERWHKMLEADRSPGV